MSCDVGCSVLWVRTQLSNTGTNEVASWKETPRCHDILRESCNKAAEGMCLLQFAPSRSLGSK